jgi:hypothetical protein
MAASKNNFMYSNMLRFCYYRDQSAMRSARAGKRTHPFFLIE